MMAFRFRRLPACYAPLVMPLLLSVMMTFIISGLSTLMSLGPHPEFLGHWSRAWGASWLVGFPTLLLVLPLVRRAVALIVEPPAR